MRRLVLAAIPALALLAACEGATSATAPVARPSAMTSIAGASFAVAGGSPVLFSHISGEMSGVCLSEPVAYTGLQRQIFKETVAASGQVHTAITSNLQVDSAYGTTSGARYQVIQVNNTSTTDFFDWYAPITTTSTFKVIGGGATGGVAYTFQETATYHKDASGRVTATNVSYTEGCGGPERFHQVSH